MQPFSGYAGLVLLIVLFDVHNLGHAATAAASPNSAGVSSITPSAGADDAGSQPGLQAAAAVAGGGSGSGEELLGALLNPLSGWDVFAPNVYLAAQQDGVGANVAAGKQGS